MNYLLMGIILILAVVILLQRREYNHERDISNSFGKDILLAYDALKEIANIVDRAVATADPWTWVTQAKEIQEHCRRGRKIPAPLPVVYGRHNLKEGRWKE